MNKEEIKEIIKDLLKDDREPNIIFPEFKRIVNVLNDQLPSYLKCNIDYYNASFSVYLADKEFNGHGHKEILFQIGLRKYEKIFTNFPVVVTSHCSQKDREYSLYENDEMIYTPEDVENLLFKALKSDAIKEYLFALKILRG